MKKLRVTVDGKVFEVTVEMTDEPAAVAPPKAASPGVPAAAPVAAAAPTPSPVSSDATAPGAVRSPLAGKIVSIDVQAGATVAVGAQLVTIEAMKMNTFVYADRAGKITAINTKPGDAVEEGAALLVIG